MLFSNRRLNIPFEWLIGWNGWLDQSALLIGPTVQQQIDGCKSQGSIVRKM